MRVLAGVGFFIFVDILPSGAQLPPAVAPGLPVPAKAPPAQTPSLGTEATGWLADLVRINTTNPPGNEQAAAKYIAAILEKDGIKPEILDLAPGRSALVARLRSAALADPSRALLLVAHMDVVGVDRARWTVDPFAAVMKDGYLYANETPGWGIEVDEKLAVRFPYGTGEFGKHKNLNGGWGEVRKRDGTIINQ